MEKLKKKKKQSVIVPPNMVKKAQEPDSELNVKETTAKEPEKKRQKLNEEERETDEYIEEESPPDNRTIEVRLQLQQLAITSFLYQHLMTNMLSCLQHSGVSGVMDNLAVSANASNSKVEKSDSVDLFEPIDEAKSTTESAEGILILMRSFFRKEICFFKFFLLHSNLV